jgi:hypothetical protein
LVGGNGKKTNHHKYQDLAFHDDSSHKQFCSDSRLVCRNGGARLLLGLNAFAGE